MMEADKISETLGSCPELTGLVAREDVIVSSGFIKYVVAPVKFIAVIDHSPF
jgi:hypothetical protein